MGDIDVAKKRATLDREIRVVLLLLGSVPYLEHAIGLYFGWRFFLDANFSFFDTWFGAILFSVLMLGSDLFFKQRKVPE